MFLFLLIDESFKTRKWRMAQMAYMSRAEPSWVESSAVGTYPSPSSSRTMPNTLRYDTLRRVDTWDIFLRNLQVEPLVFIILLKVICFYRGKYRSRWYISHTATIRSYGVKKRFDSHRLDIDTIPVSFFLWAEVTPTPTQSTHTVSPSIIWKMRRTF